MSPKTLGLFLSLAFLLSCTTEFGTAITCKFDNIGRKVCENDYYREIIAKKSYGINSDYIAQFFDKNGHVYSEAVFDASMQPLWKRECSFQNNQHHMKTIVFEDGFESPQVFETITSF